MFIVGQTFDSWSSDINVQSMLGSFYLSSILLEYTLLTICQRNQTHVVKNFAYLVPCTCSLPILSRAIWWSHRSKFGIFYDTEAGETITFCWKFMIPSSVLRVYVRATCRLLSTQFYWLGTVHMIRQGFSPIWIFCSQSRETIKLWYRRLKPVPKTDLAFHLCLKSRNFLKCGVDDQHWFDPNPIFNRTRSL